MPVELKPRLTREYRISVTLVEKAMVRLVLHRLAAKNTPQSALNNQATGYLTQGDARIRAETVH